jgi:hypothetical protein
LVYPNVSHDPLHARDAVSAIAVQPNLGRNPKAAVFILVDVQAIRIGGRHVVSCFCGAKAGLSN